MTPYEAMTVTVPEGEDGGMKIEKFTIGKNDIHNFRHSLDGRGTAPGDYTRLMEEWVDAHGRLRHRIWMSDTDAEKRDHYEPVHAMQRAQAKRVLINGLGLGMVVGAALALDHVEHVDVVERDERVIRLVGSWYDPERVTIHHADAYEQAKAWPKGTRWDVGWSDIWQDLCTDNLPDMTRLRRSYGGRCAWHDCWGRHLLAELHRQERRETGYW